VPGDDETGPQCEQPFGSHVTYADLLDPGIELMARPCQPHCGVGRLEGMDNGGCTANGWSIITSASANSQLAGLLAGFVFSGIAILVTRPGVKNAQALTLFCAAFPVLGFDSYLFSLVSGGNADPICLRVWSQGEAASGMLGVGGLAVVTGISWLISSHLADHAEVPTHEIAAQAAIMATLNRISRFMVHGAMIAITLLLAATALDYLVVAAGFKGPAWLAGTAVASPPLVVAGAALLLALRRSRRHPEKPNSSQAAPIPKIAAYGTLSYAVIVPLFAGTIAHLPTSWWDSMRMVIVPVSLTIGLFIPAALLVLLVHATPPLLTVTNTE
jgi:hypothetical protein